MTRVEYLKSAGHVSSHSPPHPLLWWAILAPPAMNDMLPYEVLYTSIDAALRQ